MKKKVTLRNKQRYPGLNKNMQIKVRKELVDCDYEHKLSPEEKQWYSNFLEEYNGNNFNHEGKAIHKKAKHRKSVSDANNHRNSDSFSVTKGNGMLLGEDKVDSADRSNKNTENKVEDAVIKVLDYKNKLKRLKILNDN